MSEETGRRLKAQKKMITAYLSAKNINARAAARREAVTKRSKRFADVSNQGKGFHEELATMHRAKVCAIAKEVQPFCNNGITADLHKIKTCRRNYIASTQEYLHLSAYSSSSKISISIDGFIPERGLL